MARLVLKGTVAVVSSYAADELGKCARGPFYAGLCLLGVAILYFVSSPTSFHHTPDSPMQSLRRMEVSFYTFPDA